MSSGAISFLKKGPRGVLIMMSSRTLGTSAKKNRAKKPATPPNPAARVPLYYVSASSGTGKVDVQLDEVAGGDAVEVALDGVPGGHVSSSPEHVLIPPPAAPRPWSARDKRQQHISLTSRCFDVDQICSSSSFTMPLRRCIASPLCTLFPLPIHPLLSLRKVAYTYWGPKGLL